MREHRRRPIEISRVSTLRVLAARTKSGPVMLSTRGRRSHVLLRIQDFERLYRQWGVAGGYAEETLPLPEPGEQRFSVLCRIDAWAHYVAQVDAETAEEAAELASDNHGDYKWLRDFTQEFDAREYVTLDGNGDEIEETKVGDF